MGRKEESLQLSWLEEVSKHPERRPAEVANNREGNLGNPDVRNISNVFWREYAEIRKLCHPFFRRSQRYNRINARNMPGESRGCFACRRRQESNHVVDIEIEKYLATCSV